MNVFDSPIEELINPYLPTNRKTMQAEINHTQHAPKSHKSENSVTTELDVLEDMLGKLENDIVVLQESLDPILLVIPPDEKETGTKPEPPRSQLEARIIGLQERVSRMTSVVNFTIRSNRLT